MLDFVYTMVYNKKRGEMSPDENQQPTNNEKPKGATNMTKSYTAYVMDKADREIMTISRDYPSKKEFAQELRQNGFAVKFISTPEKFNHDLETYCEKKERRNKINRFIRAELKKAAEKLTEETTEEPQQEGKTMTATREFFTLEEKTRKADNHYNIVADSDTEYTVKNAPTTEAAVKLAMIKYVTKLESVGTPAAALLASAIRDAIKYEYFSADCGYNYSGNGGGAFEISVDYLDDTTTAVYLRVAEILEEGEEPEEEKPEEEKPTENETDSAFIAEMVEALKYFKRVLWNYIDGTRYERDIFGDFWGAHECGLILSFVNDRLKAQGAGPHYKLKNDFDDLAECFEEIKQKFEHGDERTIEEIISEYNFS